MKKISKAILLSLGLIPMVLGSCGGGETECDPTDPTGECYVEPSCDETDPDSECYIPPKPTNRVTITVKDENGVLLGSFEQLKSIGIYLKTIRDAGIYSKKSDENLVFNRFFKDNDFTQPVMTTDLFTTDTTLYAHYISETYEAVAYKDGADFKTAFKNFNDALLRGNRKSYESVKYGIMDADIDPDNDNRLIGIYDHSKFPISWGGGMSAGTWNREHVWPQSRMLKPGQPTNVGASDINHATDLVNLRACEYTTNEAHSNYYFGFPNSGPQTYYTPQYDRGEVVRILLYMESAYDLYLVGNDTSHIPTASKSNAYGYLPDLLRWWLDEPTPSEFEIRRQDVIKTFQNNRNPFVDEPLLIHSMHDVTKATPAA